MASAARAYEYDRDIAASPLSEPRQRFKVVPGTGRRTRTEAGLNPLVLFSFKIGVVALVLLGVVGLITVWLQASTVDLLTQTATAESSINSARAQGSTLEVQYSILSNPSRVKTIAAEQLGMTAADSVTTINISMPQQADTAGAAASSAGQGTVASSSRADAAQTAAVSADADAGVTSDSFALRDAVGSTTIGDDVVES